MAGSRALGGESPAPQVLTPWILAAHDVIATGYRDRVVGVGRFQVGEEDVGGLQNFGDFTKNFGWVLSIEEDVACKAHQYLIRVDRGAAGRQLALQHLDMAPARAATQRRRDSNEHCAPRALEGAHDCELHEELCGSFGLGR